MRISSMISFCVITWVPSVTATRSSNSAESELRTGLKYSRAGSASEGLPYGEKELELAHALRPERAIAQNGALNQLLVRAAITREARRIETVGQIDAHRAHRASCTGCRSPPREPCN